MEVLTRVLSLECEYFFCRNSSQSSATSSFVAIFEGENTQKTQKITHSLHSPNGEPAPSIPDVVWSYGVLFFLSPPPPPRAVGRWRWRGSVEFECFLPQGMLVALAFVFGFLRCLTRGSLWRAGF